ncbi:MAG: CDP-glycerol glycerophosphotransferase family protein [Halioglobus sp.]
MKIDKRSPRHWLLLLQQGAYTLLAIAARYVSRRPAKPVVVLYGHQLSGNLRALYAEWQRGFRDTFDCYFLSLDPVYSRQLRAEGVPVLQCNRLPDMLFLGRCDAVVTDHGLHAMSLFIPLTNILYRRVAWYSVQGALFRMTSGYNSARRNMGIIAPVEGCLPEQIRLCLDKVRSLGYARADKLFLQEPADPVLRQQLSIPAGERIVLYAPTWQQDDRGRALLRGT